MSDPLIQVERLTRVYREDHQEVRALGGVDLRIDRGEFLAIAGPSGSGKTTLLNLMGGLDRPTSGRVVIEGRDLAALDGADLAEYRRGNIGFVFQAYNLVPVLSALENVEYVMLLLGVPRDERRARARAMLHAVGLEGLERRTPAELSGGQQQRVAVARAIAAGPKAVLADEPTANLDSQTAIGLLDLMARLNREQGMTFVFSSHDPRVLERARRLVQLRDGLIVTHGL